jgi:hypothetical protein
VSNLEHDSPSSSASSSSSSSSSSGDAAREPMMAMVRDLVTLAVEFHHQLTVTDTSA